MSPDSLIYPIFVDEALSGKRPIEALPGQYHYGIDAVCEAVEECLAAGVTHCILFGLPKEKDACGSCDHRRVHVRVHRPRPLRHSGRP